MVATVTAITSASATVHYFEQDGYYAKNSPEHRRASFWHGAAARDLGLGRHVKPKVFESILAGYVPGTNQRLGRARDGEHQHRPGVDITFSAPKSVSLQALVMGDERVIRAHDEAVRSTLDMIERDLLVTRVHNPATGKRERRRAQGMVAGTFRHLASRNLDPQLHTHSVVANMSRGPDGSWRSLDTGRLHSRRLLIGAHYRNELARRLMDLGYELQETMIGPVQGFEIAGWRQETLDAFSTRRKEIVDHIEAKGWDYNAATAQAATLATRRRKKEPHAEILTGMWRMRATELGIDLTRRRLKRSVLPPVPSALDVVARVAEHLEERQSVIAVHDLVAGALAHAPGRHDLDGIHAAIDQLRRDGHLVDAIRSRGGPALVTDRALRAEREVLRRMKEGVGKTEAIVPADEVEKKLEDTTLTAGQRQALRLILAEGDSIVGVQGFAGTGKTTMLREVVELAGAEAIVGLAPSSSAARTLGREAGIATRTLQWFLTRHGDLSPETEGSFEGKVLVVDEMSLASTAQVRSLMRVADHLGVARLVMVGDSRQLRSVEAGQPFRQLQRAGMATAVMDDIRRQRNPGLKAAVLDAIAGKPGEALTKLGADVIEVDPEDLGTSAARIWLALSPQAREETALMAPTHVLRREINETVREGLREEGVLHGRRVTLPTLVNLSMTRAQKREIRNYRAGDVVVFHNDLHHYRVKSGDICPIRSIDGERLMLDHGDGRARRVKPDSDVRYRYDVFETDTIDVEAGDRIRWTRNHNESGLVNGATAVIEAIGHKAIVLDTDDGRRLKLDRGDPRLRHIAHAYASTVHAAQGLTRDKVIAVLDSGHGHLANQQTFYVEISRARDEAIIVTDNREQLAETLEENTGEVLTALEAVGEGLDEGEMARRVPEKESVADLGVEPLEIGRWKRARNPALAPDDPGAIAQLKALSAMRDSSDERVAAQASAMWVFERARTLVRVEARLAGALERQPALRRVGGTVDPGDYAAWRFDVESGLAAARELLTMVVDEASDLAELAQRAEAVLASDDRVFARQAANDHVEAWEARWRTLERRASEAGLSVHDYGEAPAAVDKARRVLTDPALGRARRDRLAGIVEAFDERAQARRQAGTWLAAWDERDLSDRAAVEAMMDDARMLSSDSAMPATLKSRLDLAVDRHERLAQAASLTAAAETTAEPSTDAAEAVEPVAPVRVTKDAATAPPPIIEDDRERETRRERAREAANRARRRADDAHRQLADWEARLAEGRFERWIAHADAVARDPDLGSPDRRRLEGAMALARRRLDAHEAHQNWRTACQAQTDHAASQGGHVLDHPGRGELVAVARRLAADPDASGFARRAVTDWLADHEAMAEARKAFLGQRVALERVVARAEAEGENPLDLAGARRVVEWIRDNLNSAGVTETERQAMGNVMAQYEARQAELKHRDRGISWRL
ncbi:MAG: relaxase domain-containing protein [bacterium]|nr:relaxase domain-containing protein [bacterium]